VVTGALIRYFAAASAAAGALIGLLFVAISLRPESIFGDNADATARRLAESSFTGLVNVFFVSLVALVPTTDLGYPAVSLALISLWVTLSRHVRRVGLSQLTVLLSTLVIYLGELGVGIAAILAPNDRTFVNVLVYLVIAALSLALTRAWSLMAGNSVKPTAS
jgi:hypothetical protein